MDNNKHYRIQAELKSRTGHVSIANAISIFLELIKVKITVMVTLTTALGFVLGINTQGILNVINGSSYDFTPLIKGLLFTVIGIFLLACAASVMNHYQERYYDSLMNRTMNRPIPSGRIKAPVVLVIFFLLLLSGVIILLAGSTAEAMIVGLITLVWYNFVYTPLKRKTAFAIIPGALVGALPPLAGWAAVNTSLFDPKIILIVLYFFVWQIPHFWLLLILYGNDYEKAGYPTLNRIFSDNQLKRITFMWLMATVITGLIIPVSGLINYSLTNLLLVLITGWMIYNSLKFLFSKDELVKKLTIGTFVKINIYTLLIISLLSVDKLIKLI